MRTSPLALGALSLLVSSLAVAAPDHSIEIAPVDPGLKTRKVERIAYPEQLLAMGLGAECRVRVSIDKKGRTERVERADCPLDFARYTIAQMASWRWRDDGGTRAHTFEVVVHYRIDTPRAEKPDLLAALSDEREPIILGELDRAKISAVIAKDVEAITYCYQRRLAEDPSLAGKVVIKFIIAKDGSVSSANPKSSTLEDEQVERCLVGRIMRMRFPEPTGGGIVIVSYPFHFSSE